MILFINLYNPTSNPQKYIFIYVYIQTYNIGKNIFFQFLKFELIFIPKFKIVQFHFN